MHLLDLGLQLSARAVALVAGCPLAAVCLCAPLDRTGALLALGRPAPFGGLLWKPLSSAHPSRMDRGAG
eukprot:2844471-Heterocapsa_arctica.AAC.1